MPIIKIEGHGSHEAKEGQRLVKAIMEAGLDIGHRCGGQARCTTCRVRFIEGEPDVMTEAEYEKLKGQSQLEGLRLACQIVVDRPMAIEPLMLASEQGWDDAGPDPAVEVEPEAEWHTRDELEKRAQEQE